MGPEAINLRTKTDLSQEISKESLTIEVVLSTIQFAIALATHLPYVLWREPLAWWKASHLDGAGRQSILNAAIK